MSERVSSKNDVSPILKASRSFPLSKANVKSKSDAARTNNTRVGTTSKVVQLSSPALALLSRVEERSRMAKT